MSRESPGRERTRRRVLQLLGTGGLAGTAGCSGFVGLGSDGTDGGEQATTAGTTVEATTPGETTDRGGSGDEEGFALAEPSGDLAGVPLPSDLGAFGYATMGTDGAPVTATMYGAWFCPYTDRVAENFLGTLVAEYVRPGKVALRFRAVPYRDGEGFHGPDEPKVARVALAVWNHAPRAYWPFFGYLFANVPAVGTWSVDDVLRVAEAAGVEATDPIRRAYEGTAGYREAIAATMERVRELPIRAVPRIVVGGTVSRPSVAPQETIDQLEAALEGSLAGNQTATNGTAENQSSLSGTAQNQSNLNTTSANEATVTQSSANATNENQTTKGTLESQTTGTQPAGNETANEST
jgi:protein-disulfide isomerase